MIMGDICTRDCQFCAVSSGNPVGIDPYEPERVARAVMEMNLRYAAITSVTRDDLPDGGASLFAHVIRAIRRQTPHVRIEVLTPDFKGQADAIDTVIYARPDVFNHNLETVRRLQVEIRPAASYRRSLDVLRQAADRDVSIKVKSGLMVGLGETDEELAEAMHDLLTAGCRILTIGQYLAPTRHHRPVSRYVEPARFEDYARMGKTMGFTYVASGPLVRSSYMAEDVFHAE